MRAEILLAIIAVIAIAALLNPRIGLYGYIWFGLMRPDLMAFAGRQNLSVALAVVTLVSSARYFFNIRYLFKPIPILLILFEGIVGISAAYGLMEAYSWLEYGRFFRMSVMCLLIPLLITDEKRFRELFLVTAASLGFIGLYWGLTAGIRGARIWNGPGGFMSDNNSFAVGLAMVVPFCWHARSVVKPFWAKAAFAAMLLGSIVAVILTYSRGGALALGVALLLLIIWSKRRARMLLLLAVGVIPILVVVGASYTARLSTIRTYEQDASAMSRIVQLKIAYKIWTAHPLLGIGIGDSNYFLASRMIGEGEGLIVHNSFFQVLVHTGIFGLIVFMAMLLGAAWTCWRSRSRLRKTDPDLAVYPTAIFVSLMAYTVGSLTHPRAWFDFFYMLLIYSSTWSGIMKRRSSLQAPPRVMVTLPPQRQHRWTAPQISAVPIPRA